MRTLLVAVVLLAGCNDRIPWAPPPVADDGCEQAWARLAELGCPEATSPKGTSYATVCRNAAANGVRLKGASNVGCLRDSRDCAEAGACL